MEFGLLAPAAIPVIVIKVLTTMDSALLSLPLALAAPMVKLLLPVAAGVPAITPVEEFKANPAGSAPLATLQLTPGQELLAIVAE